MHEKWEHSDLISFNIKIMVKINAITSTSWLTRIRFMGISLTHNLERFPFLIFITHTYYETEIL